MIAGTVRELKTEEYRVGLTPEGVRDLTREGHRVLVEAGAGSGSGFDDEAYRLLQLALLQRPERGAMIQRSGGLRKARWPRHCGGATAAAIPAVRRSAPTTLLVAPEPPFSISTT